LAYRETVVWWCVEHLNPSGRMLETRSDNVIIRFLLKPVLPAVPAPPVAVSDNSPEFLVGSAATMRQDENPNFGVQTMVA